jgi:PadR family transcriptional regulator PadR
VEGTLYPLLTRLRKAGLVEYKWVESTSGPPRKYFKLTDEGLKFLTQLDNTWEELIGNQPTKLSKRNPRR